MILPVGKSPSSYVRMCFSVCLVKDWTHPRKSQILTFLSVDMTDDFQRCVATSKDKKAIGQRTSKYLKRCLTPTELHRGEAAKTVIDVLKNTTKEKKHAWFDKRVAEILKAEKAKKSA